MMNIKKTAALLAAIMMLTSCGKVTDDKAPCENTADASAAVSAEND